VCENQIAIISPSRFPGRDGSTANFTEMIHQFKQEGLKVILICPKSPDPGNKGFTESSDYLKVIRIPYTPPRLAQIKGRIGLRDYARLFLFLFLEVLTVLWTLKRRGIKYTLLRHSILTLQLPMLLKLIGIKIIADGELLSDSGMAELNNSAMSKLLLLYEKQVVKMYSYFKVTTQGQAEKMVRWGLSRERILNIPVSIDIDRVPGFSIEEIPEHTFGYFGVLEKWQGVDILLEAFRLLHQRIPSANLYVIGDGSMKESLKQMVSESSMSSSVIFINGISRDELWNHYFSKFRIVVIPRPRRNNIIDTILPIKLVESLAAGKPVIAVDIPAMKEVPTTPILLIPSSDPLILAEAMERLSSDRKQILYYSSLAKAVAINYDIKENIKKLTAALSMN
jgi:glycosyltransferase involved in cell wall biosynthesis